MIADMMAAHVAAQVPALKPVRPVSSGRRDKYPHAVYETVDMRSKRHLNCPSAQREGTVRFYVAGRDYAEVTSNAEALKESLLAYAETGDEYRVRRVDLIDESDIYQLENDQSLTVYVKSIDFAVKALKL